MVKGIMSFIEGAAVLTAEIVTDVIVMFSEVVLDFLLFIIECIKELDSWRSH